MRKNNKQTRKTIKGGENINIIDKILKENPCPAMTDNIRSYKTKNILYGNYKIPNAYIKFVTINVIKAYSKVNVSNHLDNNEWSRFFDKMYTDYYDYYTYDTIIEIMGKSLITNNNSTVVSNNWNKREHGGDNVYENETAINEKNNFENSTEKNYDNYPSFECVVAFAMRAYKSQDAELITRLINTFGRPLKLDNDTAWLDNWSLNGPGNALNLIVNYIYDCKYFLSMYPENVQQNKHGPNYDMINEYIENMKQPSKNELITFDDIKEKYCKHDDENIISTLVGYFRTFLIVNKFLPILDGGNYNINNKDDILNISVRYFPVYYIGAIACDWFDGYKAPKIKTIVDFVTNNPNNYVIAIVNSASSKRSSGAHWMGLGIINKKNVDDNINNSTCSLMCSQASNWSIFQDQSFVNELKSFSNMVVMNNNNICCQYDGYNCGVYSLLFDIFFVLNKGDLQTTINSVGRNAENLRNNDKIKNNSSGNISISKMINVVRMTVFGSRTTN